MHRRGVSPVVGLALLIGLVSLVSVGLLVVGASVVDSTAEEAAIQQAERSLGEFADTADEVAHGPASSDEFEFGSSSAAGTSHVDGDAGQFEIVLEDEGGNQSTLVNTSLGAVRYELSDGTTVAYQGGGVWRHEDDYSVLVDSPNLQYRAEPVPTLTFPHVRVDGQVSDTGAVQGELSTAGEGAGYPINETLSNPVEGENLYVGIESEYCDGWERHVERRTDATFDERCGDDGRLVANLTVGELPFRGASDGVGGAIVGERVNVTGWNPDSEITGDVVYSESVTDDTNRSNRVIKDGELREVDDANQFPFADFEDRLDDQVDNANTWESFNASRTYSATGPHYIDDVDLSDETFDIDASSGTVTVVVRDNLTVSSQDAHLNVTGDNEVRLFVDGSVEFNGAPDVVPSGNFTDPSSFTIVTGGDFLLTGDTELGAVVVAPSGTAEVESSDATLRGALVADNPVVNTATVEYAAEGWEFDAGVERDDRRADEVYYLHVSESILDVDA